MPASPIAVLAYIALSVLIGFLGRKRAVGFSGSFVLALIITPAIMALVLLVARYREDT